MFIVISATYLGYHMYYDGYIASDINTGDCITYAVEQVLLSENSQEKKKEMIEIHQKYGGVMPEIASRLHLENIAIVLKEALDKLKQHTRNYAKRQLTWFRRNPALKINY